MDDASNLNSILRGVLISNPHKIRLSALKREFRDIYGKEFPFTSFGFKTFFEYLRSIPDVVQIAEVGHPDPIVLPVTTDKSLHVENMVMRQRVDKKKTGYSNRGHQRRPQAMPYQYFPNKIPSLIDSNFPQPSNFKENQSWSSSVNINIPKRHGNYSNNQNCSNTSGYLEFVCEDIKKLLDTNPSGITYQELTDRVFIKGKYRDILIAAGITTTRELVHYCSDFALVKGNMIFSKWGEKTSVLGKKYINIGPVEEEYYNDRSPSPKVECSDDSDKKIKDNFLHEDNRSFIVEDDEDQLGSKVISNFRKLLKIYPYGIWCAQLPDLYYKEFRVPLDFGEWNYTSVIQMASRLPNVFRYVREGSCSDWKLFDARLKQNCNSNSSVKEKTNLLEQKWIPQPVLDNIKHLLAQHPTGILCKSFYHKFSEEYNIHLEDLGFKSFQDLLSSDAVKEIVHIREAYNDVYLLPKKVKRTEDELPIPSVPALPEFQKLIPQLYPKEVCGPDFVLPKYPLGDKVPFILQVRVTEVSHPGCFWMVPELEWDNLEDMMNDINDFYSQKTEKKDQYMMPESTIFKGLLCAAQYGEDNKWHRARIRHYFSMDDEVKIEYIDFGTISVVKKSMLRFLHRDFTSLPQLSIKGKLYGIQSKTTRWPKQSGYHLLDYVSGRSLLAEFCVCKSEESYAEIVLYEPGPGGTDNFIINNYFVSIGVATFVEEGNENVEDPNPNISKTVTSSFPSEVLESKPSISKEELNFSYQHPENNSVPENTMCMPPPRPPPGFTENDKNLLHSCPNINYNSIPSVNNNLMGLLHQNERNPLVQFNTGFQIGQQMQQPMMPFGNSLPNNMNKHPYPYQMPLNTYSYQPTNIMPSTDPFLNLLTSILKQQIINLSDVRSSIPDMVQPLDFSQNFQRSSINRVDNINVPSSSEPANLEHLPPSPKFVHSNNSLFHNPEYVKPNISLPLGSKRVHSDTSLSQSSDSLTDTGLPYSSTSIYNGRLPHSPENFLTDSNMPYSSKYIHNVSLSPSPEHILSDTSHPLSLKSIHNDSSLPHSPQNIITDTSLSCSSKYTQNDNGLPLDEEHIRKHVSSSCYSRPESPQKSKGKNTCAMSKVKSKNMASTFEERFPVPSPGSHKNENSFDKTNIEILSPVETNEDKFKRNDKPTSSPNIFINLDRSKTPENWEDLLTEFYDEKLKNVGASNQEQSLRYEDSFDRQSLGTASPPNISTRRDTSLIIPPIANKQLCPSSKVTTCLRNIKIDQPEKKECLLRKIDIGSHTVHIMKQNGLIMVSSEEIIKIFTSFSSYKVVMKILQSKRINFPFSDVFRNQSEKLFEELDRSELFALNKRNGLNLTKINVLPLEVVPILLTVLKVKTFEMLDFKKAIDDYTDEEGS